MTAGLIELPELMARARSERWCVQWGCTTCGSNEMRAEFTNLAARHGFEAIASALSGVRSGFGSEVAEWLLLALSTRMSAERLQHLLDDSSAADLFRRMLNAKSAAEERRRAHALRSDPQEAKKLRDQKKALKAEAHQKRLLAKKSRDADFHDRALSTKKHP